MGAAINLQTTYTEADPNNRIVLSTVTATATGVKRDESAYVYKDYGAGFIGDFVHEFTFNFGGYNTGSKGIPWGLSNTVGSKDAWAAGLYLQWDAANGSTGTFTLGEVGGSTTATATMWMWADARYCRMQRSGTTLTLKAATSANNRRDEVWDSQMSLTLTVATTTYQYHYALTTINESNTSAINIVVTNKRGTDMSTAGTPFDSVFMPGTSGDWSSGATWGNAGSVKGTDYPGSASDVVQIAKGRTVTYDVSETNALGAMTVEGVLSFKPDADTKMVFGNTFLTVQAGGHLRIGSVGTPIEAAHLAELYFTTTGDNQGGVVITDPGTAEICGSDLTDGTLFTYLTADWTSGQTFTVHGDVTGWAAGQRIIVHRFRSTHQTLDIYEYTIASVAANGGNTDITINEAAPGVTYRAGGICFHVSRNVICGKVSPTYTLTSKNSSRPRFTNGSLASRLSFRHATLIGLYQFTTSNSNSTHDTFNLVIRNSEDNYNTKNCVHDRMVQLACGMLNYQQSACFKNSIIAYSGQIYMNDTTLFDNSYFINQQAAVIRNSTNCVFRDCDLVDVPQQFSNANYGVKMINCNSDKYRHHANTCPPTYDWQGISDNDEILFINCRMSADPPHLGGNTLGRSTRFSFENYNQVEGDNRKMTYFWYSKTNATVVRDGGAAASLEVYQMDNCLLGGKSFPLFEWVEWDVAASAQTRKIYIRGGNGGAENWSTYPTAAELFLEAEYYDEAGTCHKTFVVSTAVLTDNTTWTAFSLSFTPGRVGQVVYRLRLGLATGIASKKIYVDPQLNS